MTRSKRKLDIPLISMVNYNSIPIDNTPIVYDLGDKLRFEIDVNFIITPNGFLELSKIINEITDSYNHEMMLSIDFSLGYTYGKVGARITRYWNKYSAIISEQDNKKGIYNITNEFEIDSKRIPADSQGNVFDGSITLAIEWTAEVEDVTLTNDIATLYLPIFYRRGHLDGKSN